MNAHGNRNSRSLSYVERSLIILLLAAIALALAHTPAATAQEAAPQVMADQYFDAMDGGDSLALITPNAVLHTPEGEFAGRAGVNQFGTELQGSFSNLDFATQSVESVDNLVIIRFALTGTNTGGYHDVEANCAGFAVPGVAVLKVSDGGVVEQWIGYDSHWMVNQLLAFNQFDPNIVRQSCADQVATQVAPSDTAPPSCLSANRCETPW